MINNKYKILIIDDDPTICLIAGKKLSQRGYQIISASTGKEGIQCVLDQAPDLILLDYTLPDISGIDVCRRLRTHSISADKPIVFITGKDDYESIEQAFQAGATDFCRKPLNWTILIYRIQYLLRANEVNISLLSSEASLKKAQKIARIANWNYNPIDKIFKWSDTISDLLEIDSEQKKHLTLKDFFASIPKEEVNIVLKAIDNCLYGHVNFEIEHRVITNNGEQKIISHLGNIISNDASEVIECIGTLQDITERRHSETQIRTLAYYDSLTGLMNRESFLTVLDKILISNCRNKLLSALLFIDLDDFKRVNDTLGHVFGDLLLCGIAERLKACVRTAEQEIEYETEHQKTLKDSITDTVFRVNSVDINRFDLGRLGGDEFVVFLTDIHNKELIASIAKRLLKALETPFCLDGHELYVTFSIGIAISPSDGEGIHTLLKNADTAMYNAKANGKNNFQFYTKEMNERSLYRLNLETDLRNAIDKNELYLVYQPQYNLKTGQMTGAEALMRWNHASKGEIAPSEFITLAEETGQILVIGVWLFKQFKIDIQNWEQQGLIPEDFKFALNISSLQFHQSDMMDKVRQIFSDFEFNKHVEFELTESVMMTNAEKNMARLNSLADINISLAIDDFGTGYSSLSYLHRFPVSTVKIDRSFIANIENGSNVNIVKAIIAMAHGMNITVVAEGIESQVQYDFLKKEACDIGQGFFLNRPMSKDKLYRLLKSSN